MIKFIPENAKYELSENRVPSEIEGKLIIITDNDCSVCPHAIKCISQIDNDKLEIIVVNISYPEGKEYIDKILDKPILVTPTTLYSFDSNDPDNYTVISGYDANCSDFIDFIKLVYMNEYVERYGKDFIEKLENFAKQYGYYRNPVYADYISLVYRALKLNGRCPCRKIVECPCSFVHNDMQRLGRCYCGLFWSKEKVKEYIENRINQLGIAWELIPELKENMKVLEESLEELLLEKRGKHFINEIILRLSVLLQYL